MFYKKFQLFVIGFILLQSHSVLNSEPLPKKQKILEGEVYTQRDNLFKVSVPSGLSGWYREEESSVTFFLQDKKHEESILSFDVEYTKVSDVNREIEMLFTPLEQLLYFGYQQYSKLRNEYPLSNLMHLQVLYNQISLSASLFTIIYSTKIIDKKQLKGDEIEKYSFLTSFHTFLIEKHIIAIKTYHSGSSNTIDSTISQKLDSSDFENRALFISEMIQFNE